MRIQTKDLADQNREKLWEVVPLSTPWSMYIDVSNLCNFKCIYCPTGNPEMLKAVNRHQGHMPTRLYVKIVNDLKQFPEKLRIVNLYKDGDPLVNPNFVHMVNILRDADVTRKIYSKTNGELIWMHPTLDRAPLDMLGISVPHSNPEKFPEVVGKKVNYAKYRDGIKRLYESSSRKFSINAKMALYKMTQADIDKFYQDFEGITDTVALEGLHGWGASEVKDMFLEDDGPHDGVPINWKLVCPLPFYLLSVSSNGIVNTCCAEWGNFHNHGDVNTQSIRDIWEGERLRAFQMLHLEGERFQNQACKDCQYRDCLPDNLDEHRLTMIERFKNA